MTRYRRVSVRFTEAEYDALQRLAREIDKANPPNERRGIAGVVEEMVCYALEKIFEEPSRQKPKTVEDARRLGFTVKRKKD